MKVYVVWHSGIDRVLGIYNTEKKAQKACEKSIEEDKKAGLDCTAYRAEWSEWELDGLLDE